MRVFDGEARSGGRWLIVAAFFLLVAGLVIGLGVPGGTALEEETALGYTRIEEPISGNGPEVVEYFWYGCPHCNALQPHISAWRIRLPEEVVFRLTPVALKPEWVDHARAFYAAETLGVRAELHPLLFDAIHEEKRRLDDAPSLAGFAAETTGISAETFLSTMHSDAVDARISSDIDRIKRLGLKSTPTLVVNGRYRITPGSAGGYATMLEVTDRLLAGDE